MNVSATLTSKLDVAGLFMAEQAFKVCEAGALTAAASARGAILEQVGAGVKYPDLPNKSSAPGEAPVNQLGDLADSIHTDEAELPAGIIGMDAVAGGVAGYLELGTNKMHPRPFMGPAAEVGTAAAEAEMAMIPERMKVLEV